jgi:hypothetical protein
MTESCVGPAATTPEPEVPAQGDPSAGVPGGGGDPTQRGVMLIDVGLSAAHPHLEKKLLRPPLQSSLSITRSEVSV